MPTKDKAKKRIAVIGYGSQGRAVAWNFRDSGWAVTVGLPARSTSRKVARKEGFAVSSVEEAVQAGEVICFAFPDHLHGRVFRKEMQGRIRVGSTLWFLAGTSVHFGFVKPPKECDVVMVAPHAPGVAVREKYLSDKSISAFYAIEQNHSRRALQTVYALAAACGFKRQRLVKTTFGDEAVGDLFGEQAVLCGGMAMLVGAGYETLVKRGISPENAYLEVAYQLDLIVALVKKYGMHGMWERISVAARYGSLVTGPKLIDRGVKARMAATLREIESGRFASKLEQLSEADARKVTSALKKLTPESFERAVKKFRTE